MDDPAWTWPAWKFNMKREDLSTNLHDQYNTYCAPIQSPDAFYHDIAEIAHTAQSVAEFHHLAHDRRQQRLDELNQSLESASFEIINPNLIEAPQWEHAVQLFRSNSLDSLVQFFASYLPQDHRWHPLYQDSIASDPDSSETLPCVTGRNPTTAKEISQRDTQNLPLTSTILDTSPSGSKTLEINKPLQTAHNITFGRSGEFTMQHKPQRHTSVASRKENQVSAGAVHSDSSTLRTVEHRAGKTHDETTRHRATPCIDLCSKRVTFECTSSTTQKRESFHYDTRPNRTALSLSKNSPYPPGLEALAVTGDSIRFGHRSGIGLKRKRS